MTRLRLTPSRSGGRGSRAAALGVAGALLVLSSCGGSPQSEDQAPDGKPLPGIKEFGLNEVQFAQHIEQTQAQIAECMADAGFEYVPVDVKTIEAAQARVRMDPGYTRRSYKEKWGLAVTTRYDDPVRDTGLGPNLEIWQSLPEADQEAYSRTLWGDESNDDFVFAFDEEDFSGTGGCTRDAVAKVFTPAQLKGTYVNPKDVLVESDPRIIEAENNWTECMRDAGYDYEDDQDEIIEDFQERLEALVGEDDPQTLTGARAAELRQLQQEEIEVSLVDLDCQLKYTDAVFEKVEIEVFGQPVSG
ncbi:MAG TPA: hypothetical protein VLB29_19335 [Nocardioidaceae bacterium]|nr:hypothetical protein [Nocardioidaceae bacterium]